MIVVHGVGPVYWGVEYDTTDPKRVSYAWLVQDMPPYRRSTRGVRIRVGRHALHLGLCVKGEDPHRRMQVDPTEIGKWGHRVEEEAASDAGAVEVRQPERCGADDGPGDGAERGDDAVRPIPP